MKVLVVHLFFLQVIHSMVSTTKAPPPCFSQVYCHGFLLHTVQMSRVFNDSKTFVDMKMRASPSKTLTEFSKFMVAHDNAPNRAEVRRFVDENFEPPGQEFLKWEPEDWKPEPKFLSKVKDRKLARWGRHLNGLWKDLGRKIKEDVRIHHDLYSMIWVPNPVIVPGGRFREFYYWDSYWIIRGLLLSEMHATAKGMLENFLYIVDKYGHVPNGGRIYYLERSQPPLLIPMVKMYLDATNDVEFVKKHVHQLEREFNYWIERRSRTVQVRGKSFTLATYGEGSHGPRPESYYEDVTIARNFSTEHDREAFYSEIKAAAESGWDFSSRWFITNGTNLIDIKTRSIIPVDLNAIIYWNAKLLRDFNELLGHHDKSKYFGDKAEAWLEAVTSVLWHEDVGAWLDYDVHNSARRHHFYPSNIAPLWTGCYRQAEKTRIVGRVLTYLEENDVFAYQGGMPTSFEQSGEQWDYPNVWPPLQHMLVVGLSDTKIPAAENLARQAATSWIRTNYVIFDKTKAMFEKYDAVHLQQGIGGEYEVQLGFGWTNGIILDLLDRYGNEATLQNQNLLFVYLASGCCAILLLIILTFIGVCMYRRRRAKDKLAPQDNGEVTILIGTTSTNSSCYDLNGKLLRPNVR